MIIYEKRNITINELITPRGHFQTDPLTDFFREIQSKLSKSELHKNFRKYFSKFDLVNLSKVSDEKIDEYYEFLVYRNNKPIGLSKILTYDSINGFAYHTAKKYLDLKSGGFNIDFIILKESSLDEKTFFFFDKAFKIFIGKIVIEPLKRKKIKGNVYKIVSAAAERKLVGLGYGLKMYLTILEYCDYLTSDSILYSGSFKIWSKILPKYVNVWCVDEEKNRVIKITPEKPFDEEHEDIDFFVASMYHKKI